MDPPDDDPPDDDPSPEESVERLERREPDDDPEGEPDGTVPLPENEDEPEPETPESDPPEDGRDRDDWAIRPGAVAITPHTMVVAMAAVAQRRQAERWA